MKKILALVFVLIGVAIDVYFTIGMIKTELQTRFLTNELGYTLEDGYFVKEMGPECSVPGRYVYDKKDLLEYKFNNDDHHLVADVSDVSAIRDSDGKVVYIQTNVHFNNK